MRRGRVVIIFGLLCAGACAGAAAAQAELVGPPEVAAEGADAAPAHAADSIRASDVESTPLGSGAGAQADGPRPIGRRTPGDSALPREPLSAGDGWWRTASALALVVGLIIAVGAGARRWARRSGGLMHALGAGGRAPSGLLQVMGRYPVGRGQTLVLLKLDRRILLVSQAAGVRGGAMQTLCELTEPEEVASILMLAADADGRSLAARFRESMGRFDAAHDEAERALVPLAVEPRAERLPSARDPLGSLRSRLDSLRRTEWGGQA